MNLPTWSIPATSLMWFMWAANKSKGCKNAGNALVEFFVKIIYSLRVNKEKLSAKNICSELFFIFKHSCGLLTNEKKILE